MDRTEPTASLVPGRLAVLSAHLADAAVCCADSCPSLWRSPVSAQTILRPPGGLSGALTVVDGRTGKKYEIPISEEGTVRATDLKKVIIRLLGTRLSEASRQPL